MNAYSHRMGKAILTIVGVLLSIWLIFMVIGMIISALKFLIWIGLLAVIGAIIVTVISKLAKSS
jgi:phage-related protein